MQGLRPESGTDITIPRSGRSYYKASIIDSTPLAYSSLRRSVRCEGALWLKVDRPRVCWSGWLRDEAQSPGTIRAIVRGALATYFSKTHIHNAKERKKRLRAGDRFSVPSFFRSRKDLYRFSCVVTAKTKPLSSHRPRVNLWARISETCLRDENLNSAHTYAGRSSQSMHTI